MMKKIYAEAQRIGRSGLGTISLSISTYEEYDMICCTYHPAGWHDAQRAVNDSTATLEQLKLSQSSATLASVCQANGEALADLLFKLEAIQ